ncbi:MAG: hypothetical protein JWQ19_1539 [Subtercola sp.]|nr:hypothetical protein [Subtercola sp.]
MPIAGDDLPITVDRLEHSKLQIMWDEVPLVDDQVRREG